MNDNTEQFKVGAFQFSGTPIDKNLGESEYTLVGLAWDKSGSVSEYAKQLDQCLKDCISGCRKSPRAENLMLRMLWFNNRIEEVFGFKELKNIDEKLLTPVRPSGSTALFEATENLIASVLEYSRKLIEKYYSCNGVVFIMTDGDDNASAPMHTKKSIRRLLESAKQQEIIDSLVTVLVGVEDASVDPHRAKEVAKYLEDFQKEAGLDAFVNMGKVTPQRLAKLAQFVSQSVSSASQALQQGTGKSVPIATF